MIDINNRSLYPHGVKPVYVGNGSADYFATDKLRRAVNLAIALGRPLLVQGDPGVGKTRLAASVAQELTGGNLLEWRVKSSERVRDGLYHYDPIRRLIDTQLAQTSEKHRTYALNPFHYIRFSYLGKAIIDPQPVVLLIDEIDKADIDFPNDLLRELDELWFEISEVPLQIGRIDRDKVALQQAAMTETDILEHATNDEGSAFAIIDGRLKPRPIIIITSNDEKPLPPAFLRRCLVHRIEFPDINHPDDVIRQQNRQHLMNIIKLNVGNRFAVNRQQIDEHLVYRVIDIFAKIRNQNGLSKLPATAELVEWVVALYHPSFREVLDHLVDERPLPFWRVVAKSYEDQVILARELKGLLE